jgi:hypothetical protein
MSMIFQDLTLIYILAIIINGLRNFVNFLTSCLTSIRLFDKFALVHESGSFIPNDNRAS